LGLVIALLIALAGVASAATVNLDISAENVTYGDTFQVTVMYTGEGYLQILDFSEVVWSTALSRSGHDIYTIGTTDLLYPGTYTVEAYVEDASGANATDSKIISVTSPTPIISIKKENEGGKVAAEDLAKFKVSVYGASSAKYTITGSYGSVSGSLTIGENEVVFNTSEILTSPTARSPQVCLRSW